MSEISTKGLNQFLERHSTQQEIKDESGILTLLKKYLETASHKEKIIRSKKGLRQRCEQEKGHKKQERIITMKRNGHITSTYKGRLKKPRNIQRHRE